MKIHSLLIRLLGILVLALLGCRREVQPALSPSDNLRITPGVGIVGYCEVGMTVKEIKRRCPVVRQLWVNSNTGEEGYDIPDWGIGFVIRHRRPVDCLSIYTTSIKPDFQAFKGYIDERISFSSGTIDREPIIDVFGHTVLAETNSLSVLPGARSFSISYPNMAFEYLCYSDKGIGFALASNIVKVIMITSAQIEEE